MVDYHVPNKMDIDWVYTIFGQTLIWPNLFVETGFFMSAEPQSGLCVLKGFAKGALCQGFPENNLTVEALCKAKTQRKMNVCLTVHAEYGARFFFWTQPLNTPHMYLSISLLLLIAHASSAF